MRPIAQVALLALLGLGLTQPPADPKEFTDWSEPVNLGPIINTPFVDSCVAISKDGLSLFFSSNRQNPGNPLDRDLYVSARNRVTDAWGEPVALTALNSTFWDSCPALSLDEHRLYFTTRRLPSCGIEDIWVATRHDRRNNFDWGTPVNLGCASDGFVNSAGRDLAPTFFEDDSGREVMYFSSTGLGAPEGDHYQSIMRDDGTFGPAVAIPELNSASVDQGITVRRDGLEVFLLSNRPGGSGYTLRFDFWRATRASTQDAWSAPEFVPSLGSPAYAQGKIALSFNGRELYFTSSRGNPTDLMNTDLWVATRERLRGRDK